MAETIRIEIPIEAKDNTGAGIASVQSRLTGLERSLQRMERMFSRMDKSQVINLDSDKAEQAINSFEDKLDSLGRADASVSMQVDNSAMGAIEEAQDAVAALDGEEASASLTADNRILDEVSEAGDALSSINGDQANTAITADEQVTDAAGDASDALSALNGSGAVVEVSVSDMATEVLQSIIDLTNALNGATASISVTVDDSALSTLTEIQDMVSSLNGSSISLGSGGGGGGSSGSFSLGGGIGAAQGAAQSAMGSAYGYAATAAGFAGMSLGFSSALRTFESFEAGMSQVQAISGATASQMEKLTEKALEMGAKTKFTATQSAEAFNYMAMAGWDYEQMMAGIEPIMNLAAASGLDLGRTSDIVTDALTAFGLKAEDTGHFADVLAMAAASSNTNVDMLGESFKYVAPAAGALGYSIEDVAIGLGLMANSGIKSSMAGTSLRRAIMNLSKPSEEMQKVMDDLKISLTDDEGNLKSLGEVMDNIRDKFSGLSEAEKVTAASTLFGATAMSGMLSIINASESDYQKLTDKIYNAKGAAKSMAEIMMDNMYGSLTLLSSAFDGVQMAIGGGFAPSITTFADGLTESMPLIAQAFTDIIGDTDELEIKLDGLTDTFRQNIQSLINSDEWADADAIGKIDLAWDQLIGNPLKEWAGTDGVHMVSGAISDMFQSAGDVLSGEGTMTDWLKTGLLVSGAEKAATAIGGIVTAVQGLAGAEGIVATLAAAFNPVAVGAAAAVIGVVALAAVIDDLNQKKIELNLEEHFGDLSLDLEQIEGLSGKIVPVDVIAELNIAEQHFKNAESLVSDAEKELKNIGVLNWEVQKLGLVMTGADFEGLEDSASIIQEKLTDALKEQNQGVDTFLSAIMPQGEASEIASQIDEWFAQDMGTLNSLGNAVQDLIQKSIDEGMENIDTASAISILQGKMMDIVSGARQAELQGSMDWLNARSSLAALDADSWAALVSDVGRLQNDYIDAMQPQFQRTYAALRQLEQNDPSRSGEIQEIRNVIDRMVGQLDQQGLAVGTNMLINSLRDAYGEDISAAQGVLEASEEFSADNFLNGGLAHAEGTMLTLVDNIRDTIGGTTQDALADRFSQMLPSVDALGRYIDNATEPIPAAIKDAYDQAIEIGAMSGDASAMRQYYASRIVESLPDGTTFEQFSKQMEKNGLDLSEEWMTAFERAFTDTVEGADFSEAANAIAEALESGNLEGAFDLIREAGFDIEMDGDSINIKVVGGVSVIDENGNPVGANTLNTAIKEKVDAMNTGGNAVDVDLQNQEMKITLGEAYIDDGATLDTIEEALSLEAGTLAELNPQLENVELEAGMEITIPLSSLQFDWDASGLDESLQTLGQTLDFSGNKFTVGDNGSLTVTLSEATIESGSAWDVISEALGTTLEGLGELPSVDLGKNSNITFTLSEEGITIEAGGISAAVENAIAEAGEMDPADVQIDAAGEPGEFTGIDEAKDQFNQDAQTAFDESADTTGTQINASAEYGSDNGTIAAAYEQFKAMAQAVFSTAVQVTATINVSASTTGAVDVLADGRAEGGFIGGPELSWVGEDGPEYIIPVGAKRKGRGLELWEEAGRALGAFDDISGYADGGLVGGSIAPPPMPSSGIAPNLSEFLSAPQANSQSASGGYGTPGPVNVSVNLSPSFNVNEGGGGNTVEEIRRMMLNLADDMCAEISKNMATVYANMPIAQ